MQTVQFKSRKPLSILPVLQRMQNVAWLQAFMRGIGPAVIGALAVALRAHRTDGCTRYLHRRLLALTVAILLLRKVGPFPLLGGAIAGTPRKTLGWEQLARLMP